uniref:Thioredoxin domain-containing protein n=1 Tax=Panagrellus redivivus TaxID=6233 RepID=A0A7E4VG18_PANRE
MVRACAVSFRFLATAFVLLVFAGKSESVVVELTSKNIDSILQTNRVVIVNFYMEWCGSCIYFKPKFEEASKAFDSIPTGQIVFAAIDGNSEIADKYKLKMYPTIKTFSYGKVIDDTYYGPRNAGAIIQLAKTQLESTGYRPIMVTTETATEQVITTEAGYTPKPAFALRDECNLWLRNGDWFHTVVPGLNIFCLFVPR